jgi:hypothetical protein
MQYLAYLQMKKILPQEWKETIHSWCDCVLMDGMLGISACIHDVTMFCWMGYVVFLQHP